MIFSLFSDLLVAGLPEIVYLDSGNLPSASAIARARDCYDIFSLPLSCNSFIPNQRLSKLLFEFHNQRYDAEKIGICECKMQTFPSSHSWKTPAGGSETHINDPVLSKYLNLILKVEQTKDVEVTNGTLKMAMYLAGSAKPEYRLQWKEFVVLASEAKGTEDFLIAGLAQGFQLGGDSSIRLSNYLDLQDAVVPVVLSNGTFLHIFAVYLLDGPFPVITALSDPICYLTPSGRLALSRWAIALSQFTLETISLLSNNSEPVREYRNIGLSFGYFFKPIINLAVERELNFDYLNHGSCRISVIESMMTAYKQISEIPDSKSYFLFPVGVLSYPSGDDPFFEDIKNFLAVFLSSKFKAKFKHLVSGCPLVVFPLLDRSWKMTKPVTFGHKKSYLLGIATAIKILNAARVAHCDLRPPNIMWKEVDGTNVSIQVIDFEDSYQFDIYFQLYSEIISDRRYPFYGEKAEMVKITSYHNYWYLVALKEWVLDGTIGSESFSHLMTADNYNRITDAAKAMQTENYDPVNYMEEAIKILEETPPPGEGVEPISLDNLSLSEDLK